MTDIEIISFMPGNLAPIYFEAKEYCEEIPNYSLLNTRSCSELILDFIAEKENINLKYKTLQDNIDTLKSNKIISRHEYEIFNKIRINGNRGAHPKEYNLSQDILISIAKNSIELVIKICIFYLKKYNNIIINEIEFT